MIKRACRLRSHAPRPGADSWQDSAPCLAEAMLRCLRRCLPALEPLPASLSHGFRGKRAGAPSLGEVLLRAHFWTVLSVLARCHQEATCSAASLQGRSPQSLRGDAGGGFPFQRSLCFVFFLSQCCPQVPA